MKLLTLLFATIIPLASGAQLRREIATVEVPPTAARQGIAPLPPYRVYATYKDGSTEWRQARWDEDGRRGTITGDGRTIAPAGTIAKAIPVAPVAKPLPLTDVRITDGNRLADNFREDVEHLLALDITQQLYNYRDTYGLPTEGYTEADGWDSPTTKLKGHGSGHYMSALALAYASTDDKAIRSKLLDRMRRMTDELRLCQERTFYKENGRYFEAKDIKGEGLKGTWADFDRYKRDWRHYGYGYINAIPAQHCVLIEHYAPYNNEAGVWAPYYTIHKQLSGLIDIATLCDDKAVAAKALLIAKDMGLWVWNRLSNCTFADAKAGRAKPGNRYEMWNMYIAGEVGGMGESLARLSTLTGDKRLLDAAAMFDSPAFFDPLAKGEDGIRGRHANQHIPMVVGAVEQYSAGADSHYLDIARTFWHLVQGRYRYAMGGVGNGEMFRQPYTQALSMLTNAEPTLNETCCAYNMAKLTRYLNAYDPSNAALMDYHERVIYNQIVGSLNPKEYGVTYQYAVGLCADKPWGNDTPQSTCCGGTGAENHAQYTAGTYWTAADTLWIAQYLPTTAKWKAKGIELEQACQWPAEATAITITKGTGKFAVRLRVPYWATAGFTVKINGADIAAAPRPGSYLELPARKWKKGDRIDIAMPFAIHTDWMPDKVAIDGKSRWLGAVMLGPLVMCATDIHTWAEACVDDNAKAERLPGLRVKFAGHTLIPDYEADRECTHYFAFNAAPDGSDAADFEGNKALAKQRLAEPQLWAPHGLARVRQAMDNADAAALATALATMRPATLAEPEDLEPLRALMKEAPDGPALEYARMVERYVVDGSGTKDMIEKAIARMQRH